MFPSKQQHIKNKNTNKPYHQIFALIIILALNQLVLNVKTNNNHIVNDDDNLLVVKNNKIAYIEADNLIDNKEHTIDQRVWITNTQEAFKIEVFTGFIINQQYFTKLSQALPILSANLQSKGYLKALTDEFLSKKQDNSKSPLLRGYKYAKPTYNIGEQNVVEEIGQFLKVLIRQNNLGYLNLRLQDSFILDLIVENLSSNHTNSNTSFIVTSFDIKYLFPTVQYTNIPVQLLSTLNLKSLQQHLSLHSHQSIQRKLSGTGLHMMINWTLILDDKTDIELQPIKESCWLQFTDVLPQTTYVDADQRRKEITNYEIINVQKPAFDSKQYYYSYTVNLNEFQQVGVNKYRYQQPIHFRYPQPSLLNYTKVYLHSIQKAKIQCLSSSDSQVSSQGDTQEYKIYEIQENSLFDRGTVKIPNGDISKSNIVSIATLVVCLVTVMMIISRLKKF